MTNIISVYQYLHTMMNDANPNVGNNALTENELKKVFQLYENYGAEKLPDFIRMIWKEAYNLGYQDAQDTRPRC